MFPLEIQNLFHKDVCHIKRFLLSRRRVHHFWTTLAKFFFIFLDLMYLALNDIFFERGQIYFVFLIPCKYISKQCWDLFLLKENPILLYKEKVNNIFGIENENQNTNCTLALLSKYFWKNDTYVTLHSQIQKNQEFLYQVEN